MTLPLNETHDPAVGSWVESANDGKADFPVQNLPFGVFRRRGAADPPRVWVAIGEYALDLARCARHGLLGGLSPELRNACRANVLNPLMSLGQPAWSHLRRHLFDLLRADGSVTRRKSVEKYLQPQAWLEPLLPAEIGDYTDFYASLYHAANVGRMFRPDSPLLPNYKYLPIAYHGRASSIVVSGTPVRRPAGQSRPVPNEPVQFGPTRQLDYELEMGFFVGSGNPLGTPVPLDRAEEHIFGLCLVNDWSARDIQSWEYQPLGPFLAKSFATTISPWVVTLEALAPFRCPSFARQKEDPNLMPYLFSPEDRGHGGIDVTAEVLLCSEAMRKQGIAPVSTGRANLRDMYWTLGQMLAHHTSNGCNLRTGDLLATGTISGEAKEARGCLLELTRRGQEPLTLPSGETRAFLEKGDEVTMRAHCESPSAVRIGFGACRGTVIGG